MQVNGRRFQWQSDREVRAARWRSRAMRGYPARGQSTFFSRRRRAAPPPALRRDAVAARSNPRTRTQIAGAAIARLPPGAPPVEHLRRSHRGGFKAGALAEGLARSDALLIATWIVAIDGRLQWREWTTQEGQKRESVDIIADTVQFLGGRDDASSGSGNGFSSSVSAADPASPCIAPTRNGLIPTRETACECDSRCECNSACDCDSACAHDSRCECDSACSLCSISCS